MTFTTKRTKRTHQEDAFMTAVLIAIFGLILLIASSIGFYNAYHIESMFDANNTYQNIISVSSTGFVSGVALILTALNIFDSKFPQS
ncbi:hypothetical protein AB4254_11010 [Vibrio breoganii]